MIIGTAGHVDHGKTALVKALTGVDADRLAEEKRRGITIDLGYAYTDDFGFVDVPGHERFVHTMLAGAGGIDAALFVVALPEGIRPQTVEHARILDLLGIDRGVVALTKADLTPERTPVVTAELRALLAGSGLADAPILPVSALTGAGLPALRDALRALGGKPRDTDGHPRLAIDRVFTLTGAGLIVTGTLIAGRIALEDRLILSPSGIEVRVRGLHAQNKPAEAACAGQRVALNLTGPRLSKDAVARGHWVLHPDIHAPTFQIDARIHLLADARSLKNDTQVHLHLGAEHVPARMILLDADRLEPNGSALVRLTAARPIGALARDRLVLRDAAATQTIGGGSVVDPFPPRRGRRTPQRLARLLALDAPDAMTALHAALAHPPHWLEWPAFARAWNLRAPDRDALPEIVGAVLAGDLVLDRAAFDTLRAAIVATLTDHHRNEPDQPGLQPERLRLTLTERPPAAAFRAIADILARDGTIARDGPWLRLPDHRVRLSPTDEALWAAARAMIAAERCRPPRVRDIAKAVGVAEPAARGSFKRLQRLGQVIELAQDHFFLRETVAEMAHIARDAVDETGLLTAAAFRDRLDNGRKVAIQILEYFDRVGLTIRQGDHRTVRADRLTMFGEPD